MSNSHRLLRIERLKDRISGRPTLSLPLPLPHSHSPVAPADIDAIILHVLWADMQLCQLVNVFPLQCRELEECLPVKQYRGILKMINTMIASSKKQVKEVESDWKTPAIEAMEHCQRWWDMRWDCPEYGEIMRGGMEAFERRVGVCLGARGLQERGVFVRALMMRFLQDID